MQEMKVQGLTLRAICELKKCCVDFTAVLETHFICQKDNEVLEVYYVVISAFGYRLSVAGPHTYT